MIEVVVLMIMSLSWSKRVFICTLAVGRLRHASWLQFIVTERYTGLEGAHPQMVTVWLPQEQILGVIFIGDIGNIKQDS